MKNLSLIVLFLLLIPTNLLFASSNSEKSTIPANNYLTMVDYRNREVTLEKEPIRIISLAPNVTETIFALGAQDKLLGRTDYCDFPSDAANITSIGTLLQPSIEKIVELNPDLIIASTHFSNELLAKLTEIHLKVIVIDEMDSLDGLYTNILDIGLIVNKAAKSKEVVNNLKTRITELTNKLAEVKKPKIYYVISYGQYGDYTAGGDTFISEVIELAGGNNIAKDSIGWSYSLEKIVEKNPDIIICSKYYGAKEGIESSTGYKELPAVKNRKLFTIDNNLVDRQGPRIADGMEALAKIFHPELF